MRTTENDLGGMLTQHAAGRLVSRSLHPEAVAAVLDYGRVMFVRGAAIHAVGRKEILWFAQFGIDLSRFEGVQVVCSADGMILTAYRDRRLRSLRDRRSRRRAHLAVCGN